MKIGWATDIHFDHCTAEAIEAFLQEAANEKADCFLLVGDLTSNGEANHLIQTLQSALKIPVYFVLGNHDFYGTSIKEVRLNIDPDLHYLTQENIISLSPKVALIGHDGWADCRAGDYEHSTVGSMISDFYYIEEFKGTSKQAKFEKMQSLARESVQHIERLLPLALETHEEVILLTHVPPFKETCLYEGKMSGAEWLPFFMNQSMGDCLKQIMAQYPDKKLTVLCGHTHSEAHYSPLPNLTVHAGFAEYGKPHIQPSFFC